MNQTLTRIRACTAAVSSALGLVTALAGGATAQPQADDHATTVDVPCKVRALVEAITTANSSPGADTLRLARRCTYKLMSPDAASPANGLPVITSEVTIDGNGATITRAKSAPDFRILLVGEEGALTLNRTTISGGRATDCPLIPGGEGAVCGGGINNQGTLTVNHSRVVHNAADSAVDGIPVEGGGIDSDGPAATLNDTDVSDNTAIYTGRTAGSADGGGIANDGPLTLNRSRVTNNTVRVAENPDSAAFGAGHAAFAETTIEHSTISGNHADAPGGIARGALTNAVDMTVTDTVISRNTTSAPRGLATGGGVANNAPMHMVDTRVVDNTATAAGGTARGGGIRNAAFGQLTLTSSKVLGNTAGARGGIAQGGGIDNPAGGTVTTHRSDIGDNAAKAPGGGTAQGGGIFTDIGSTTLNDSAVTGNRAGDGGGIFEGPSGTVTLNNTVVKRNKPNNCAPPNGVPGCIG
ncbi:hypothetical protein BKI49_12170 [Streptomyces sp. Tue6028]|uniref:hypothetical protein n=1 Tax=Streptomyces sp. Tue6028 TaxID=2036037 RepID=UPI000BB2D15F|nr:hypothetical protein [Streptomyces sp. Tue6028]PBC63874.1 hypothetical protein BKI49_12170 [Streptomyces sp. Tue6028]